MDAVVRYRQNAGWERKTGEGGGVVEILVGFRGQNSRRLRLAARECWRERLRDRS